MCTVFHLLYVIESSDEESVLCSTWCPFCFSVLDMYRVFPFIQLITKSPLIFMNYTDA